VLDRVENSRDRLRQLSPFGRLQRELRAAFSGEAVIFGAPVVFRNALLDADPPSPQQPMQRRIQRTLLHLKNILGISFDCFGNGVAMQVAASLAKGDLFSSAWPEFLPNGQGVLFAGSQTYTDWTNAQIVVQQPTGEGKNLAQGSQPRYSASGHLLYAQSGTLMAAPFDARRLALSGAAVPVPASTALIQPCAKGPPHRREENGPVLIL
jgi:hypothetical protein